MQSIHPIEPTPWRDEKLVDRIELERVWRVHYSRKGAKRRNPRLAQPSPPCQRIRRRGEVRRPSMAPRHLIDGQVEHTGLPHADNIEMAIV